MKWATLGKDSFVEYSKEELVLKSLCFYKDVLEDSCMGNELENGFIVVNDGIIRVEDDIVELFIKY